MQYYIYGKGGNGKVIAWIIDKLNKEKSREFQDSYTFIDDSSEECNLVVMQDRIKQDKNALILISSIANQEAMADKLLRMGLTNYCNGVAYFGKKINAYYQEKFAKNSCKNIALLLDDLGFKHFGYIREMLLERNYNVFYLCLEHKVEFYDNTLNPSYSLLLTTDFLPFLTFCPFIVGTSMQYRFDVSVKYLRLMPSYDIPFDHSYFHTTARFVYRLLCYDMLSQIGSYSAVHCKKSYDKIRQVLDGRHYQYLLRLGYPSLDKLVKDYRDYESSLRGGGVVDTIICSSRFADVNGVAMKERMIEVVDLLLANGYRVCYKIIPQYDFKVQADIAKRWRNDEKFVFFTQRDLNVEELSRSITLVDFGSSLLYTYPLITSKPSIILEPNSEWFRSNYHVEDNFYEQRLHLKAYCNEELLCHIDRLKKDLEFLKERRAMIAHYIKNETYNFGSASEAVVDFIDKYYKRWANKTLNIGTT